MLLLPGPHAICKRGSDQTIPISTRAENNGDTALCAGNKFTGCMEICFANINKEAD